MNTPMPCPPGGSCELRCPESTRGISPTRPAVSGPAWQADHLRAAALRVLGQPREDSRSSTFAKATADRLFIGDESESN